MQREKLKSRLGFILLSAGCAIGIGNIWRFPYVVGNNGGGIFVLFYLAFLMIMGVPLLSMEYAIGRASGKSVVCTYDELTPDKKFWNIHGKIALLGNYILMIFYSSVSGWMGYYFFQYLTGGFENLSTEQISSVFSDLLADPITMTICMLIMVAGGFLICSIGLQKGVEAITKYMMLILLGLIVVLAIHSMTLPGGAEGIRFYLYPDLNKIQDVGLLSVLVAAMNQAFFTLSIGIGAMLIFGSYMDKGKSLLGESITVAGLDTFVAVMAGLIIFPACFAYGVNPDSGPSLVFITLPNVFSNMTGGRIWGTLFFLFMTFASLSTLIAVFENIMACCMDYFHWSRKKSALLNFFLVAVCSMPCVLGFNLWSNFQPLGEGSTVLDLEDFIVSNLILPIGSIFILLYCVLKSGWGYQNYLKEVNRGDGLKMTANKWIFRYFHFIVPVLIAFLVIYGIAAVFA
ncbi:MAG: sodium-dependent transporter [Oscillospiraceae bacterium]|nr:sodium-dependent transporter [Oscillospiraceae bacterium]